MNIWFVIVGWLQGKEVYWYDLALPGRLQWFLEYPELIVAGVWLAIVGLILLPYYKKGGDR